MVPNEFEKKDSGFEVSGWPRMQKKNCPMRFATDVIISASRNLDRILFTFLPFLAGKFMIYNVIQRNMCAEENSDTVNVCSRDYILMKWNNHSR